MSKDLKDILAISGRSGLYKLIGQMKNGIIVESLQDGKRVPIYASENISALEDISIYTDKEEVPLMDVFSNMMKLTASKTSGIALKDRSKAQDFFEKALPKYDKEKVYHSDIKKAIQWFDILIEKGVLKEKAAAKKAPAKKEGTKAADAKVKPVKKAVSPKKAEPVKKVVAKKNVANTKTSRKVSKKT